MNPDKRPVAIVTGGMRGIGLAIARSLATQGFDIAIMDLGGARAETDAIAGEIEDLGARSVFVQCDLAAIESHAEAVEAAVKQLGPVSCLVNNAGIASIERGDFLVLKPENFDKIVAVNLRGTIFFTQAVLRSMLAARPVPGLKTIITISSVSAVMTSPERLDYCVTKAGLAAFSQGLAVRLAAENIAVFEVRPGIVRTEMTAGAAGKYDALIDGGLVPAGRWGEPQDVAAAVAALASGAFAFSTGSVLNVDGALSISRL